MRTTTHKQPLAFAKTIFHSVFQFTGRGWNTWCHPHDASLSHYQITPALRNRNTSSTAALGQSTPINTSSGKETTNKPRPQRWARIPGSSHHSTSHLWWAVITFSAKVASAPVRKRPYQVDTCCHYPTQVVSAHYLWPLKFSQCVLKTKKHTQVAARVLQIMRKLHSSFSDVCWIFQPFQSATGEVIDWKWCFHICHSKTTSYVILYFPVCWVEMQKRSIIKRSSAQNITL